ncbi:hypothetical protein SAZ11_47570 [Streptomyces sp. FXJ1.4098]|nr:hypothetical protein [Streptomyces sp. FXJ1.4098]
MGDLELHHEALNVPSAPGRQLIILQAAPVSLSADALALLGSIRALALPQQQAPGIENRLEC